MSLYKRDEAAEYADDLDDVLTAGKVCKCHDRSGRT